MKPIRAAALRFFRRSRLLKNRAGCQYFSTKIYSFHKKGIAFLKEWGKLSDWLGNNSSRTEPAPTDRMN
ncbi:hypothetical protein H6F67_00595 [Microcoleus sp. FACHB-1515]|uniref:hypothetical protein n=1 Tax=Cyanophyceae TaxID=3028117 RepID=UPI001683CF53|nr:hypothetical protein [Microcoleus sp. FACHB-1515]MBD2088370.1 hypothetical protein [Microcoleus sp. FACHB-1515]